MIMEAMRLSMIDHEEHQRKEAEAKKKQEAEAAKQASNAGEGSSSGARVSRYRLRWNRHTDPLHCRASSPRSSKSARAHHLAVNRSTTRERAAQATRPAEALW